MRLFLIVVAVLLTNLWVWLKAHLLAATPRAARLRARLWLTRTFRLDRFCDLLIEAIKALYQAHTALGHSFLCASPPKL